MDKKRGQVTCRNRLAIERKKNHLKNLQLQGGASTLLRPAGIFRDFAWFDSGENDFSSIE